MGKRSINFSDAEETELQREATRRGLTVSALVRKLLFPAPDADQFAAFRNEQQKFNEQLVFLLENSIKQTRFAASVVADFYTVIKPDAECRVKEIHKKIWEEMK